MFDKVYDVVGNNTSNTLDIFLYRPDPDDILGISETSVVPAHLLDTTLTYDFYNGTFAYAHPFSPAALNLAQAGWYLRDTVEWQAFVSNPLQAGPYYLDKTNINSYSSAGMTLHANPYYWFPNEKQSPGQDFAIHLPGPEATDYFDYLGGSNVTELTIPTLHFRFDEFMASSSGLFEAGETDILESSLYGDEVVSQHVASPNFQVYYDFRPLSADLMMFNVLNPHLSKYNVRRAIAHAVDKATLAQMYPYTMAPQDSPVFRYYDNYYNDSWKIPFDMDAARNLMISEGYHVDSGPVVLSSLNNPGFSYIGGEFIDLNNLPEPSVAGDIVVSDPIHDLSHARVLVVVLAVVGLVSGSIIRRFYKKL